MKSDGGSSQDRGNPESGGENVEESAEKSAEGRLKTFAAAAGESAREDVEDAGAGSDGEDDGCGEEKDEALSIEHDQKSIRHKVQSTSGRGERQIAKLEFQRTTNRLLLRKGFEDQLARSVVAPSGEDGGLQGAFSGFGQEHAGAALASPGACGGCKGGRMSGDEFFLLDGSELDHPVLLVGITEGSEDFSGDAEVGMIHVPALLGLRKSEGQAAKISGCRRHGGPREKV